MKKGPVRSPGHFRKPVKNVRRDKKHFSRTADRLHPVNAVSGVMRGGVRL